MSLHILHILIHILYYIYIYYIYMYYIYISNLGLWDAPPVVFQVFTSGIEKTPVILGEISAGT